MPTVPTRAELALQALQLERRAYLDQLRALWRQWRTTLAARTTTWRCHLALCDECRGWEWVDWLGPRCPEGFRLGTRCREAEKVLADIEAVARPQDPVTAAAAVGTQPALPGA